jgi:hypothetical protein
MKKATLILFLFIISISYAQKKKNHNMPNSTNLLDMQTEVFKDISGDSIMEGIDFSKVKNYKDMVKQANDLTPKQKKQYMKLYELQKKETNKKTKDSLVLELKKILKKKNN